jgi:hypothetical protein
VAKKKKRRRKDNLSTDPRDFFPEKNWDLSPENRLGKCKGVTAFGYPCQNRYIRKGEEYCMVHHPDREKMQKERDGRFKRRLGKWRAALPSSLASLVDQIVFSVVDIKDGKLDPEKAKAMSALVDSIPSVIKAAKDLYELKELHRTGGSPTGIIDVASIPSLDQLKQIPIDDEPAPDESSAGT